MKAPKIAAKASAKFDTWSKRPARLCEPAGPVPATPTVSDYLRTARPDRSRSRSSPLHLLPDH